MEKVPLFNSFKDMKQGFEKMLDIAEKIDDNNLRLEMIVCYGCLIQTYNESVRELQKEVV